MYPIEKSRMAMQHLLFYPSHKLFYCFPGHKVLKIIFMMMMFKVKKNQLPFLVSVKRDYVLLYWLANLVLCLLYYKRQRKYISIPEI